MVMISMKWKRTLVWLKFYYSL